MYVRNLFKSQFKINFKNLTSSDNKFLKDPKYDYSMKDSTNYFTNLGKWEIDFLM